MSHIQGNAAWHSPHEHSVTARERQFLAALHEVDARIGAEVSARYGRGLIPKRSVPVRLVRRAVFEAKKLVGPIARKAKRVAERQFNRRVADRTRIPNGTTFDASGLTFHVLALDAPAETVRTAVLSLTADVFILTRNQNALLSSATDRIGAAVRDSSALMWFGDSRNTAGVPELRPMFTRLLLRQVDALGPVVVVQAAELRTIAATSTPVALWPLQLGLTIAEEHVELIPHVLGVGNATHIPHEAEQVEAAELVRAELERSSLNAAVEIRPLGRRRVRYALGQSPLVSVIIPTRGTRNGSEAFVTAAVRSVIARSRYSNIEFVIVADDPTPQDVVSAIDDINGISVRWVRWSAPFNFSSKMNLGVACASGEYVLLLNDDIEVVSSDWIERMLSLIGVDGITYAGAMLFFDDQTIQHAGHVYLGGPGHVGFGETLRPNDARQLWDCDRMVSGVTAACSLLSQRLFASVGGFSERFPGNYNDVDLSLKVTEFGGRVAVAGGAMLYHFESKTRDATVAEGRGRAVTPSLAQTNLSG